VKFHSPPIGGGNRDAPANTPGIRHLAFAVEDIDYLNLVQLEWLGNDQTLLVRALSRT
jgi:hypothetical protein